MLVEYDETPDEYILGKLAKLVDAREKDEARNTVDRSDSNFNTVLDGIAAESRSSSRLSNIWNSIHIVNFLLNLYSLGNHFAKSKIMKVPWLKVMTEFHGRVHL